MLSGLLHGWEVMGKVGFCLHRSPNPQHFDFCFVFFGFRGSWCLEPRQAGALLNVPERPANLAKLSGSEEMSCAV